MFACNAAEGKVFSDLFYVHGGKRVRYDLDRSESAVWPEQVLFKISGLYLFGKGIAALFCGDLSQQCFEQCGFTDTVESCNYGFLSA